MHLRFLIRLLDQPGQWLAPHRSRVGNDGVGGLGDQELVFQFQKLNDLRMSRREL